MMALLDVVNVSKSFGGVRAVQDVSFEIREGEILGLIGPNGAGKTTVFNLISGLLPPTSGHIQLNGQDIAHLQPHQRSLLGIGRTFQVVRPFSMTVLENVMVPALARERNPSRAEALALETLKLVGIHDLADETPEHLTLAMRKRLEVARALATQPKLLLLDEILAGLNPSEVRQQLPLIRSAQDRGVTILIIEHIMDAVMSISDRIVVLDQGRLIAEGTPREVARNPEVIHAYLGEEPVGA